MRQSITFDRNGDSHQTWRQGDEVVCIRDYSGEYAVVGVSPGAAEWEGLETVAECLALLKREGYTPNPVIPTLDHSRT